MQQARVELTAPPPLVRAAHTHLPPLPPQQHMPSPLTALPPFDRPAALTFLPCARARTLTQASMIWIVGEYAERIDNADELLEGFLETFPEETAQVQLQLLTATVKLFLKKPTEAAQRMIQLVLSAATQESDNPDLRDRAYIYWRLLSTDPEVGGRVTWRWRLGCWAWGFHVTLAGAGASVVAAARPCSWEVTAPPLNTRNPSHASTPNPPPLAQAARDVVLAPKPVISDDSARLDPSLLSALMAQMGSLASVYHRPADTFVSRQRLAVAKAEELAAPSFVEEEDGGATPKVRRPCWDCICCYWGWCALTTRRVHCGAFPDLHAKGACSIARLLSTPR